MRAHTTTARDIRHAVSRLLPNTAPGLGYVVWYARHAYKVTWRRGGIYYLLWLRTFPRGRPENTLHLFVDFLALLASTRLSIYILPLGTSPRLWFLQFGLPHDGPRR